MRGSASTSTQSTLQLISAYDPNYSHDISKEITGSFDKLAVKTKGKTKTRGSAILNDEFVDAHEVPVETTTKASFAVDKRALNVYRTLFHSPNSPDQPGQVPWRDFLHAMSSTGFAAEKLQGSAWHFTPTNMSVERSIQFHEPHPGNKLPFT